MSVFVTARPLTRWAAALLMALVALEVLLPTGCIGIQAFLGTRRNETFRRIDVTPGRPGIGGPETLVTKADALRLWGAPARKKRRDGREWWKYRTPYTKWRGVFVWVVVPIPLMVPTGHKKIWLGFAGDSLASVQSQCTTDKAYSPILGKENGQALFGANCQ